MEELQDCRRDLLLCREDVQRGVEILPHEIDESEDIAQMIPEKHCVCPDEDVVSKNM